MNETEREEFDKKLEDKNKETLELVVSIFVSVVTSVIVSLLLIK